LIGSDRNLLIGSDHIQSLIRSNSFRAWSVKPCNVAKCISVHSTARFVTGIHDVVDHS